MPPTPIPSIAIVARQKLKSLSNLLLTSLIAPEFWRAFAEFRFGFEFELGSQIYLVILSHFLQINFILLTLDSQIFQVILPHFLDRGIIYVIFVTREDDHEINKNYSTIGIIH